MSAKKAAIVCCSNGQKAEYRQKIEHLLELLQRWDIKPISGSYIYQGETVASAPAELRAESLMDFYRDPDIDMIFDISGGDIANEILPYLDYNVIANCDKKFWGYSDLTTVINAIYTKTGRPSVLYQVRNLLYSDDLEQLHNELFKIEYKFVQRDSMDGIVVGGNIRCLLKLAGTEYWPDMNDKILLLESLNGQVPQMITYLNQLKQIGVFNKINGVLLGTFTEMMRENCRPDIVSLVKTYAGPDIPIAVTDNIGHGKASKAIYIGRYTEF